MRAVPGLAFSIPTDAGFAVGLMSHETEKMGPLVWLAEPTFDDEPDLARVRAIEAWRWPLFFPLGAALRRKVASPIGVVPVPSALQELPLMRSDDGSGGWRQVKLGPRGATFVGSTNDRSLAIYQLVNDTALKEMIASSWRPELEW
jgi:hypothetical protein